ncbi:MAG: N-6 DNA methylase [Balneola sp.]
MNKDLANYIESISDQVVLANKIVVGLYVETASLMVQNNELIKSYLLLNSKEQKKYQHAKSLIGKNKKLSFSDLIHLFEKSVPSKDKVINGVVYTPEHIKEFIVEVSIKEISKNVGNALGADISCGCGGFLITLAKKIKETTRKSYQEIFKVNLFGLDITEYSIERTKILLSLLAISEGEDNAEFEFNLFLGDALDFDWYSKSSAVKENGGFDLLIGNPPYVTKRNMDDRTIKFLDNWSVSQIGNTDLYIPFFEVGLKFLSPNGCLGYITVNSFFRSLNARLLRKLFQFQKYYLKIIDFGGEALFGSRSTYSCICFLKKNKSDCVYSTKATGEEIRSKRDLDYNKIPYSILDYKRGWVLINGSVSRNLKKIESTGKKLGNQYKFRGGFATLCNSVFVFKPIKEDEKFFYRELGGQVVPIEKEICKPVINPNRIKTEIEINEKKEQIIFPYIRKKEGVSIIEEEVFSIKWPKTYEYLLKNKELLSKRDKGRTENYEAWYAYGRNQSLSDIGLKLLFPHICKEPRFIFCKLEDLLFYNGHAFFSDSEKDLKLLKAILESEIFNYYLKYSSRNYSGDYISLSKNYIKHFGVCSFTKEEEKHFLSLDKAKKNEFLFNKYDVDIK